MSIDAQKDLDSFLAALPVYQRKQFEQSFSSLTQDEKNKWVQDIVTDNAESSAALEQEYRRLVERIPAKLREYRKRLDREHGAGYANLLGLPKGKPGRKENAKLAERIWALDAKGKTNQEIQMTLKDSGENLSLEAVESYLKTRRRSRKQ